jgi:hypothetical protein
MPTRKTRRNPLALNAKGVSTIMSTIIITGTLLIILVIASFVSANVLDMQIANTEFEQAKTNMQTLDQVIQDVALRRGSGGYVPFNERSGGIGINTTTQKLTVIISPKGLPDYIIYNSTNGTPLTSIIYRGGSKVSGTDLNLTGNDNLIVGMSDPLGYVRVAVDNGLKIKLDYFRVRIVQGTPLMVGNTTYNLAEITYIRILYVNGTMGGSDIVNFKVQNVAVNTITRQYNTNDVNLTVQLDNRIDPPRPLNSGDSGTGTAVIFTEVVIQVSST